MQPKTAGQCQQCLDITVAITAVGSHRALPRLWLRVLLPLCSTVPEHIRSAHILHTPMAMPAGHAQIGFVPWGSTGSRVLHIPIHTANCAPTSQLAISCTQVQATQMTVPRSPAPQMLQTRRCIRVTVLLPRRPKAFWPTHQRIWSFTSKCQWIMRLSPPPWPENTTPQFNH